MRERIPRSREELDALLRKYEVPERLGALADWGLELVPGDGASKLGGRPELPGAWPRNAAGFGLTHLASIALAELPDIEGRDLLPADGTLVFFGDFHPDSEGDEWLVLHVDGGETAVPAGSRSATSTSSRWSCPSRRSASGRALTLPYPRGRSTAADALERFDDVESATHLTLGHPSLHPGRGPARPRRHLPPARRLGPGLGLHVRRRRPGHLPRRGRRRCAPAAGTASRPCSRAPRRRSGRSG